MSSSLSEQSCILRDQILDAYMLSFNQFGKKDQTTKTINDLLACFNALREKLAVAVPNERFYRSGRMLPMVDVGLPYFEGEKPLEFTEQQRTTIGLLCHNLSMFLANVTVIIGDNGGSVIRRLNRRIKAVRRLTKQNTARMLF